MKRNHIQEKAAFKNVVFFILKRGDYMEWNVFFHNINKKKIETFNVFNHSSFCKDVENNLKSIKDKKEFAKVLRRDLAYYFWSKSEWEIIVTSFPPHITMDELDRLNKQKNDYKKSWNEEPLALHVNPNIYEKVDICSQVINNWPIFLDYVWSHKNRVLHSEEDNNHVDSNV